MNTQEIYDAVLLSGSNGVILTLKKSLVKIVKSRLSNMRSRQQAGLEEFADKHLRLDYAIIPFTKEEAETAKPDHVKLRISLIASGGDLAIAKLEIAGDF